MKLKNKVIIFILILIFFTYAIEITISNYTSLQNGSLKFSVSKPIIRMKIIDNNLSLNNYSDDISSIIFAVCNYDEDHNKSEIKMDYRIIINVLPTETPLKYYLKKIEANGREENINLSNVNGKLITEMITGLDCSTEQEDKYRLDVMFDKEASISYTNDLKISVEIDSVQTTI